MKGNKLRGVQKTQWSVHARKIWDLFFWYLDQNSPILHDKPYLPQTDCVQEEGRKRNSRCTRLRTGTAALHHLLSSTETNMQGMLLAAHSLCTQGRGDKTRSWGLLSFQHFLQPPAWPWGWETCFVIRLIWQDKAKRSCMGRISECNWKKASENKPSTSTHTCTHTIVFIQPVLKTAAYWLHSSFLLSVSYQNCSHRSETYHCSLLLGMATSTS